MIIFDLLRILRKHLATHQNLEVQNNYRRIRKMKPIVFYDFKPDKDDPNNKIVVKKSDLEEL